MRHSASVSNQMMYQSRTVSYTRPPRKHAITKQLKLNRHRDDIASIVMMAAQFHFIMTCLPGFIQPQRCCRESQGTWLTVVTATECPWRVMGAPQGSSIVTRRKTDQYMWSIIELILGSLPLLLTCKRKLDFNYRPDEFANKYMDTCRCLERDMTGRRYGTPWTCSPGLILGLRPANERRRHFVTTSFIDWAQTWNQPW